MINQQYEIVVDNLAYAVGIPTSKLTIIKPRRRDTTLDYTHTNIFLDGEQKIVHISTYFSVSKHPSVNSGSENVPVYARLFLPYKERSSKLYAPFTLESITDFWLDSFEVTYHINRHPQFKRLLEELRRTIRIPKEKLYGHIQPHIDDDKFWGPVGVMEYIFGNPRNNNRLCVQVDPIRELKELKKLVPEVEEQKKQKHYCIHGETAPFIPFNPYRFTEISIILSRTDDIEGFSYLNEFVDSLIVPSGGLTISGFHDNGRGTIKTRTPYNPTMRHFEIIIRNPEERDNWINLVRTARRLEEMFKK